MTHSAGEPPPAHSVKRGATGLEQATGLDVLSKLLKVGFLADRRQVEKPYRPCKILAAAIFGKRFLQKPQPGRGASKIES
jgi:hypothetical protein